MEEIVSAPVYHVKRPTIEKIAKEVFEKTVPEEWWQIAIPCEAHKKQAKEFAAILALTVSGDRRWDLKCYSWHLPNGLDSKNPACLIFAGYPVLFDGPLDRRIMIRVEGNETTLRMGKTSDPKQRLLETKFEPAFFKGTSELECNSIPREGYLAFPQTTLDLLSKADSFQIRH